MFCAPLSGIGEECFVDDSCEAGLFCFFDTCFEEIVVDDEPDLGEIWKSAVIVIEGEGIYGEAEFHQYASGTRLTGEVEGLSPGLHGTHVHVKGDLRGGCASTGGHYNPLGARFEDGNAGRYIGNLGNIEADENGLAVFDLFFENLPLKGANSVLGRSIVVHGRENGGPRVACGIIGLLE